jgi:hypothetical protein
MSALHIHFYDCDASAVKIACARREQLRGIAMVSIFRPFEKEGSEPVRCGYPECNMLNPPEAKICWTCKRPLFAKGKAANK